MTAYKTLMINAVAMVLCGQAIAQTPVAPLVAPLSEKALTAAEATQCRAVAETLRDREYEQMNNLIIRVERSPNLSVEALNAVQKQIAGNEASIKTYEGHAEKFTFAATPSDALRDLIAKQDSEALRPKLSECLDKVPPVVPSKPAVAKN